MRGCIQPMSSPMMNKMLGCCCCGCCATADVTVRGINVRSKRRVPIDTCLRLSFIALLFVVTWISKPVLFRRDEPESQVHKADQPRLQRDVVERWTSEESRWEQFLRSNTLHLTIAPVACPLGHSVARSSTGSQRKGRRLRESGSEVA